MDNGIGVGILVALTFTSTIYILRSEHFTYIQKTILGILFLFPPGQWVLALIIGLYNNKSTTVNIQKNRDDDKQYRELVRLREIGILSDEEYDEKHKKVFVSQISKDFYNSSEYKSLLKFKEKEILTEEEFINKSELLKNKILNNAVKDLYGNENNELEITELNTVENKDIEKVLDIVGIWSNYKSNIEIYKSKTFAFNLYKKFVPPLLGSWEINENNIDFKDSEGLLIFSAKLANAQINFKYLNQDYVMNKQKAE